MEIKIFSREKAVKESYKNLEGQKAVISIRDPDKDPVKFNPANHSIKAKLYLSFYDIDEKTTDVFKGFEPMAESDAGKICEYINYWQDKVDEIWVNCEAGVSRSAGIALAIAEYLNMDTSFITENSLMTPNKLCYDLVKDAFSSEKQGEHKE